MTTDIDSIIKSMSEKLGMTKSAGEEISAHNLIGRIENGEFTSIKVQAAVTSNMGEFIPIDRELALKLLKDFESYNIYIETDGSELRFGG